MVASNSLLFKPGETPDHTVVIKYVPYVGDSKRAMDEYTSEIMMGGRNTLVVHNTCEDSLLAAPIIIDLIVLTELCQRIEFHVGEDDQHFHSFHHVLSILSFLCKAPLVPPGSPVINALFRQRACIENIMRACVGLAPVNHMLMEYKMPCTMRQESKKQLVHDLKQKSVQDVKDVKTKSAFSRVSNGGIDLDHANGMLNGSHVPNGNAY